MAIFTAAAELTQDEVPSVACHTRSLVPLKGFNLPCREGHLSKRYQHKNNLKVELPGDFRALGTRF
jgi:hypothetical protein